MRSSTTPARCASITDRTTSGSDRTASRPRPSSSSISPARMRTGAGGSRTAPRIRSTVSSRVHSRSRSSSIRSSAPRAAARARSSSRSSAPSSRDAERAITSGSVSPWNTSVAKITAKVRNRTGRAPGSPAAARAPRRATPRRACRPRADHPHAPADAARDLAGRRSTHRMTYGVVNSPDTSRAAITTALRRGPADQSRAAIARARPGSSAAAGRQHEQQRVEQEVEHLPHRVARSRIGAVEISAHASRRTMPVVTAASTPETPSSSAGR